MTTVAGVRRGRVAPLVVCVALAQMIWGTALAAEPAEDGAETNPAPATEPMVGPVIQLQPVTVTAEKMSGTAQETPIPMTVITGEDLDRAAAVDTKDVIRRVPNMYATSAGRHSPVTMMSLRGVTPHMKTENPVGFFVDGVHSGFPDMDLLDIDRVEVLRGPQSTLYGRNTEAGAINIVTRDPEPYWEGAVSVGYGNYDTKTVSGVSGGPLWNNDWSYRAALRFLESDGYFTREPDGIDDVDDASDLSARVKLRWDPEGPWDVIATYNAQRYRDGSTNIVADLDLLRDDPHTVTSNYIGTNDTTVHGGSVRAVYEAPWFTVTSISAYADENKTSSYDVDATAYDIYRLDTALEASRFTQELRLSSPEGASGPRWVAGLYYFDQTDRLNIDMDMSGVGYGVQQIRTETDTRNMAAFGHVTWPVFETLSVIAGLRYDHEKKEVDNRQTWTAMGVDYDTSPELTFDAWLPKLGLEYTPLPNVMTYFTYSQGYKAGGFNNLGAAGQETYDAEYTTNYEVGVKTSFFDSRVQANLSLFWIDWTDQQVEKLILTQSNLTNAGKSVSRGVEFEAAWQATDGLRFTGSVGWNDAHFIEYTDGVDDYSGNRPPNAPIYTYSIGADYAFKNGLYAHVDWLGMGGLYYDSANTQKEDHYGILNAKAGYDIENLEVAFWVKNALDEAYATRAFDMGEGTYGGIAGDPRTFGMTVTARW
ncbi:TonB-dependent receptor [Rhodospira trueperi]|uniref:Iron complex outermembrane recepter protein n=1 Tax=Rhodospira trueperi TaxID=69960 RepID=A0A1G7DIA8_9PROT|nr:TonB-dependent receptor [Rhodospira trueperi]SDE51262.1 iron complex outermembrane recepter protein [Rhodospira trueperi]